MNKLQKFAMNKLQKFAMIGMLVSLVAVLVGGMGIICFGLRFEYPNTLITFIPLCSEAVFGVILMISCILE